MTKILNTSEMLEVAQTLEVPTMRAFKAAFEALGEALADSIAAHTGLVHGPVEEQGTGLGGLACAWFYGEPGLVISPGDDLMETFRDYDPGEQLKEVPMNWTAGDGPYRVKLRGES